MLKEYNSVKYLATTVPKESNRNDVAIMEYTSEIHGRNIMKTIQK